MVVRADCAPADAVLASVGRVRVGPCAAGPRAGFHPSCIDEDLAQHALGAARGVVTCLTPSQARFATHC